MTRDDINKRLAVIKEYELRHSFSFLRAAQAELARDFIEAVSNDAVKGDLTAACKLVLKGLER